MVKLSSQTNNLKPKKNGIYLSMYASIVKEIQINLCIYVHSQSSLAMRLCIHVAKPGHYTGHGQASEEAVYKYTVHIYPFNFLNLGLVARKSVFGGLRSAKAQTSLHIRVD